MVPPGQRDYSSIRLSRHAVERFVERFGAESEDAEAGLRLALGRSRRLGRNPATGAIAVLTLHRARVLVAIVQESTCLTVLTWNQFEPRLGEFGRPKIPRKWGRLLSRLRGPDEKEGRSEPGEGLARYYPGEEEDHEIDAKRGPSVE